MKIIQPQDMTVGNFNIEWDKSFGHKTEEMFLNVQKFIDSECIRLMVPYIPFRNGLLAESATIGTVIGSGEIHQNLPYAHYLYIGEIYGPNIPIMENGNAIGFFSPKGKRKNPTGRPITYDKSRHPQAGKMWFERMKADHKDDILRGAARISGGKAE